jgi:hypothetical protein
MALKRLASINLHAELPAHGCSLPRGEWRDLVKRIYRRMYDSLPDERVFSSIQRMTEFVAAVQAQPGCGSVPDEVIIRTVWNLRKSKEMGGWRQRQEARGSTPRAASKAGTRRRASPRPAVKASSLTAVFA